MHNCTMYVETEILKLVIEPTLTQFNEQLMKLVHNQESLLSWQRHNTRIQQL